MKASGGEESLKHQDVRVRRLITRGVMRPAKSQDRARLLEIPLPRSKASIVDTLIEERRSGR